MTIAMPHSFSSHQINIPARTNIAFHFFWKSKRKKYILSRILVLNIWKYCRCTDDNLKYLKRNDKYFWKISGIYEYFEEKKTFWKKDHQHQRCFKISNTKILLQIDFFYLRWFTKNWKGLPRGFQFFFFQ